jgi:hypothetical protein
MVKGERMTQELEMRELHEDEIPIRVSGPAFGYETLSDGSIIYYTAKFSLEPGTTNNILEYTGNRKELKDIVGKMDGRPGKKLWLWGNQDGLMAKLIVDEEGKLYCMRFDRDITVIKKGKKEEELKEWMIYPWPLRNGDEFHIGEYYFWPLESEQDKLDKEIEALKKKNESGLWKIFKKKSE